MKLAEKWFQQDGKIIHQRTFDAAQPIRAAKLLRDREDALGKRSNPLPESEAIGVIPGWMWAAWVKEAGVDFTDAEAVRDVVRRKVQSGEYAKLMATERNLF